MNIRSKRFRPAVAFGAIAVGAAIALTGCSSSDDSSSASASKSQESEQNQSSLTTDQAQQILRTALNPDTPVSELPNLVDLSGEENADAAAGGIHASAELFTAAGYTPDKFTVDSIEATDDTKATATVTVDVPGHGPYSTSMAFVKVNDTWKVTNAALTDLRSMGAEHAGRPSAEQTVTETVTDEATPATETATETATASAETDTAEATS